MIKADGNPMAFFTRPIAGGLAAVAFLIVLWPLLSQLLRRRAH
jgi:TctA family transporter